ncbi:MAG TPA: hypothetical protein DC047_17165 [Blastocatellia bacterium]|nr:hypothetical protein [Blastocatellia bacterium]
MPANSTLRRVIKKLLYSFLGNSSYKYFQAVSKAKDIRNGSWSEPELDLIPLAVKEGEAALDLGANFGLYSYHISRALGPKGRVYAFEPVPFTFATLRLVSRILGFRNVTLFEKGCSEEAGRISFEVPVQASGAYAAGQAYIGGRRDDREGKESQVRWSGTKEVICEVVALDDFLPEIDRLSLIKCDVEGAELFAFRGARKLIGKHLPTVICEINPWFLEGFNVRLEDLITFFVELGYNLYHYRIDEAGPELFPVELKDVVEDNYVFIHPQALSRFSSVLRAVA